MGKDRSAKVGGTSTNVVSTTRRPIQLQAREIYVGIDFGTRFTKTVIWSEGLPRHIWRDSRGRALIPSVVHVLADGTVVPYPNVTRPDAEPIEYLKMLIANPNDDLFSSFRISLRGKTMGEVCEPLAAAFLAELLRRIRASERKKTPNVDARWIVNIGIPVQYCDAPERERFRRVGAIAFEWSEQPSGPLSLELLLSAYSKTREQTDIENSPVSVFPELTAALHQFIRDPNRAEGLYGFCDVGGGTIDGAIFRINRSRRLVAISIPAARVSPFGTTAVS